MDVKKPVGLAQIAPALVMALLLVGTLSVVYIESQRRPQNPPTGALLHFASEAEMVTYLNTAGQAQDRNYLGTEQGGTGPIAGGTERLAGDSSAPPTAGAYSGTNVQVAGVDEGDIVKTDGRTIYAVSGGDVVILQARPAADAQVLSRIELDTWSLELYVASDRLVVITHGFPYYWMAHGSMGIGIRAEPACLSCDDSFAYYAYQTNVRVYDVRDPAAPTLQQNVTLPGWPGGSRMIGDWAYVLSSEYLWYDHADVVLPAVGVDGENETLRPSDVGYFDDGQTATTLLTVAAVNVLDPAAFTHEAFLVGGAQAIYASLDNLYVTATSYDYETWEPATWIFRFGLDGGSVALEASGLAPGWVINQYAMDERDGYLRVATTTGNWDTELRNNVYVLDASMNVVGRLEGLAPGERIFSARFLGERLYLVTFRQIDPLFVIDVGTPTAPKVLGFLEIPGVSTYLHPYGPDHVIGLGSIACDEGQGTWAQCVKLSLFDVRDVSAPVEVSRFVVQAQGGSYSEAAWDPKAFLFDATKELLVIPVQTWGYGVIIREGDLERNETWTEYYYSGWSGAYVFRVTLGGGFELRGNITHVGANESTPDEWYYGPAVRRSLYIEDGLYTISDRLVKINALADLAEIKAVPLE